MLQLWGVVSLVTRKAAHLLVVLPVTKASIERLSESGDEVGICQSREFRDLLVQIVGPYWF